MKNGEVTKDRSVRYCIPCGGIEHGILYCCPGYDKDLQDEINGHAIAFKENCISGEIKISDNGVTKTWNEWKKDHL